MDYTQLSDTELQEAVNFHRRQRNMSRGINEAAHSRQTQIVRLLEAEEARRLEEAELSEIQINWSSKTQKYHTIKHPDGSHWGVFDHRTYGNKGYEIRKIKDSAGNALKASDSRKNHTSGYASGMGNPSDAAKAWAKKNEGSITNHKITESSTSVKAEEAEQIDEISTEKKMAYGKAAFADYHKQSKAKLGKILSGDKDTSGESRKIANRLKGISTASKTEEVELDENLGKASKKMKFMFNTDPRDVKQRIKDASPEFRDQIRNTPGKLGGPAELQRRLARKMKEEVELDEAKTDVYHQHMLKALGKTRLPKDHGYTSSIANNGDFVVHDSGGRVAGRIPKGEHNLKEETMTPTDMKQREKIVKGMKKSAQDFKDRYGSNWKSVMYATATKAAMKEESELDK